MSLFANLAHTENPDQTGRLTALRVCTIFDDFWTRTGPYSPWVKDEHVQLSEMGFRRFWARRESCVAQKAPTYVGTTSLYLPHTGLQDWP